VIEQYAQLFKSAVRTVVLKRPSDVGLDYEDVFFPSLYGVRLEAWFIPANSNKLLIANHPMLWVEESNQRFYAYNHFGQHPERLVGWFDLHMADPPQRP
jgi:hypothetical protein